MQPRFDDDGASDKAIYCILEPPFRRSEVMHVGFGVDVGRGDGLGAEGGSIRAARFARSLALCVLLIAVMGLPGCMSPKDRRPGFALTGREVASPPSSFTFTDEFREIELQVRTPYGIPHSVIVWCASESGDLFIGARDPETKSWPGRVDRDPRVRVRIDGYLYEGELHAVTDPERIERLRAAYQQKYELPGMASTARYWQFVLGDGGSRPDPKDR